MGYLAAMNADHLKGTTATIGQGLSSTVSNFDSNPIAKKIIQDITRGTLAFGEKIPEAEYAQAFGVSRTPVRDAMMMLSSLGLFVIRPKYGTFVTNFMRTRLIEVFDARFLFESGGVELANSYQRTRLLLSVEERRAKMKDEGMGESDHEVNLTLNIQLI